MSLSFLLLLFFAALGFAAYEISVRWLDKIDKPASEIGYILYIAYLLLFGGFSSVLSSSFATIVSDTLNTEIFFSILGGYSIPAGGRLALLSAAKLYMKLMAGVVSNRLKNVIGEKPNEIDQSGLEETYVVETEKRSKLSLILGYDL